MAATGPTEPLDRFYAMVRFLTRFWLWFFLKRVDVRHPERVPPRGPVLLCINHPNNLIDSLLVGAVVPRKAHFLATATLFRKPWLARFLRACGAIPVYRRADHGDHEVRNEDTFAACFEAFERGRLIAIYPEGTTHAEARVQRIKTGAARIALTYEAKHPGDLVLIPLGLSFEARKSFRGRVLVAFGERLPVTPYRGVFAEDPPAAVAALTEAIQLAMEREVVHIDRIDATELVHAIEDLYRPELIRELREERGLAVVQIDPFRLSRAVVDAVNYFKKVNPERVEGLWQRIRSYRALLASFRVSDDAVRARLVGARGRRRIKFPFEAIVGFPFFVYGLLVNGLPYWIPRWLAHHLARKETDYATVRFLASIVAFPLFWSLEIWTVGRIGGGGAALAFALSLPLTGLVAFRYLVGAGHLTNQLRFVVLAFSRQQAARELLTARRAIIDELDRAKMDYLAATKGSSF